LLVEMNLINNCGMESRTGSRRTPGRDTAGQVLPSWFTSPDRRQLWWNIWELITRVVSRLPPPMTSFVLCVAVEEGH
jgi:hypothetical protein